MKKIINTLNDLRDYRTVLEEKLNEMANKGQVEEGFENIIKAYREVNDFIISTEDKNRNAFIQIYRLSQQLIGEEAGTVNIADELTLMKSTISNLAKAISHPDLKNHRNDIILMLSYTRMLIGGSGCGYGYEYIGHLYYKKSEQELLNMVAADISDIEDGVYENLNNSYYVEI